LNASSSIDVNAPSSSSSPPISSFSSNYQLASSSPSPSNALLVKQSLLQFISELRISIDSQLSNHEHSTINMLHTDHQNDNYVDRSNISDQNCFHGDHQFDDDKNRYVQSRISFTSHDEEGDHENRLGEADDEEKDEVMSSVKSSHSIITPSQQASSSPSSSSCVVDDASTQSTSIGIPLPSSCMSPNSSNPSCHNHAAPNVSSQSSFSSSELSSPSSSSSLSITHRARALFEMLDDDGDGFISWQDLEGAKISKFLLHIFNGHIHNND
jgi:hypothetical protein